MKETPPASSAFYPWVKAAPQHPQRIFLLLACLFSFCFLWHENAKIPGVDFYNIWAVGQIQSSQQLNQIYSPAGMKQLGQHFWQQAQQPGISDRQYSAAKYRRELSTTASPFLYTVLAPFGLGNYDRALSLYQLLSLISYTLALLIFGRILKYSYSAQAGLILLLTLCFPAFHSELNVVNVNPLQLLGVAAAIALLGGSEKRLKTFSSGLIFGALMLFKPNLAPALIGVTLCFLAHKDFDFLRRWGTGCFAGVAIAILVASLYFGRLDIWGSWLNILIEQGFTPEDILSEGNYSLVRYISDTWHIIGLNLILFAIFALCALLRYRKHSTSIQTTESPAILATLGTGLGASWMLLCAPLAWFHYFLLQIPLLLILLRPRDKSSICFWLTAALIAGQYCLYLLAPGPEAITLYLACATLILFGLGLSQLKRV